jgi:chemotaxis protein CheX
VDDKVFATFLEALRQIFLETGIELTGFSDGLSGVPVQAITTIGITGKLRGNLFLSTNHGSAGKILTLMMGDLASNTDAEGLAEFRKASLCELTNQIAGRAITLLSSMDMDCDITPPTIITADVVGFQPTGTISSKTARGAFGEIVLTVAVE